MLSRNVLITSAGTVTAVNLIKAFKKRGDKVFACDINDIGYTSGSLLADVFFKVPLAVSDDYLDAIQKIISENKIDLLIPINDIEVYVLSKHEKKLKCEFVIPEVKVIETLRDKLVCSKLAEKSKVLIPPILLKDNVTKKRILRDRIGVGSKGIKILESGEPALSYDEEEKFLQEFIEGEEYTVDVLSDKDGKPYYIIPRKRLEVKSGVATKVEIEYEKSIIEAVLKLCENICIPGFSNFQFIKDKSQDIYFIEINYRFSGCGAATLAVTDDYIDTFLSVVENRGINKDLNENVRWNSIVTRYYEEVVYGCDS